MLVSSVPLCKKAVVYLIEKMHGLDKLHSGMSYSAVGHKFNVATSSMLMNKQYILNKVPLDRSTHKTRLRID